MELREIGAKYKSAIDFTPEENYLTIRLITESGEYASEFQLPYHFFEDMTSEDFAKIITTTTGYVFKSQDWDEVPQEV